MGKSSKDKRDAYYRLAKEQGWRARSAFKLLQLDESFNLFDGVTRVVDLCAAPGSWSQVLSRVLIQGERVGRAAWEDKRYLDLLRQHNAAVVSSSTEDISASAATPTPAPAPIEPPRRPRANVKIVAIDLQPMAPLPGITCLKADITHPSTVPLLLRALDPDDDDNNNNNNNNTNPTSGNPETDAAHPVDLVLSDGAPDVTGLHDLDIYVQAQLLWAALHLALRVLKPGGKFVAKIFRVKDVDALYAQLKTVFDHVTVAKPRSSRASSVEAFIVCEGFRPPEGSRTGLERSLGDGSEGRESVGVGKEGLEGIGGEVTRKTVREDGVTELYFEEEEDDDGEEGRASMRRGDRWIAPFLACGDLSAFDADASHKVPEGHVSLDPVQPPTAPPYRRALEERKKMGGAYGKTKLGSVG